MVCGLANRNIQCKLLSEADLTRCTAHGQSHGGSAAAEQNAQVHQPPSQPAEGQDVNLTNGDEQEAASNVATRATVAGAQNTSATCT